MNVFAVLQVLLVLVCILLGIIFLFGVSLLTYISYLICTSEDNCTACPRYYKESCAGCGMRKRKLREECRRRRKESNARLSANTESEVVDLNE